jgi:hypothetical protein
LFDQFEPKLGDNLSNSEDIFIGFAFLEQGYRNIQLMDIQALSVEPQADHLPSQIYLWSSAFLQSCYYFDELVRGPLKAVRRYFLHHEPGSETAEPGRDRRRIREAYRQRFGVEHTYKYGRPMAWVLLLSLAEKIFFPTTLIIMLVIGAWQALGITLIAETAITAGILATVSSGHRLEMLGKGILTTPIRYASLLFDSVTITRFAVDLWVTHKRDWRK